MSDHPIDVLADRLAVHLPPNWERAHGYRGREPFIAIWWAESGDALHIDDGRYRITASGPFAFDDLIRRVTTTCDEVSPAALGYTGEMVSHCLLADLAERTVHYAPLDDALTWLTQRLPGPDEGPTPSAAPPDGQSACLDCQGRGWVRAGERPAAGYTRCLSCDGSGSVSAQVADLQRIRDALIAHHGRALPDITLDAAPLLGRAEDASDGQPVNAALLLHAVAQTSNLNHQEIRAALGARAVTFIGTAMDHVEEPSPTSGSASISKSQVVTVPSFSHFIDEMQPVRPGQVARLVLGERSRQQKGLRITDVTLDLQAINDRDEIVWLRQSVTITGFRRREGTFDVPQKQARYEAMEELKRIVEETLEARGFRVRAGRYVLPRDLVPINGAFDCAEWYRDEEDVPRVRPVAPVTPGQRYLPGYEPSI